MSGDNIEWAWIDIACIDQENSEAQAEEVGRQASIFKNAGHVYVWLSHLQTKTLALAVKVIQEQGTDLIWKADYENNISLPPFEQVDSLHKHFNILFDDPWFSSLWTLQEVVLRNDAIVLSAQGEPIWWEPGRFLYLTMLINHCTNMFRVLTTLQKLLSKDQKILNLVAEIRNRILQAGFNYFMTDNPNVQYGIAHYRTTSRDVDRVYAIMQVYNIRVGKSIRPNENPSLEELIDEFALAINKVSLIMGQMFVHTKAAPLGKSWRITEDSTVPQRFLSYQELRQKTTMTLTSSGGLVLSGPCCPFSEIQALHREAEKAIMPPFGLNIALDEHAIGQISQSPSHEWEPADIRSANGSIPASLLVVGVGLTEPLWVLLLGDIRGPGVGPGYVGLLMDNGTRDSQQGAPRIKCRRMGVCTWMARDSWCAERIDALPWNTSEVELQ
jgi:hypothetical protein